MSTPDLAAVRSKYATVLDEYSGWKHSEEWARDFDAWLAAHDEQVRVRALAEHARERSGSEETGDTASLPSEAVEWSSSDVKDVARWLVEEADGRVRYFPQRRDGVDALVRHIAANLPYLLPAADQRARDEGTVREEIAREIEAAVYEHRPSILGFGDGLRRAARIARGGSR